MRKFIFTITTGRSGTQYLTELFNLNLQKAEVHHERIGWLQFGVDSPDASHFMLFNTVGNVPEIKAFWAQKLQRLAVSSIEQYVEMSHLLAKAGLLENIHHLEGHGEVHVIILRRDIKKIVWSFFNRYDFFTPGFNWLFALDPRYPNKIVDSSQFLKYGAIGGATWYVNEIFARSAYYKLLLEPIPFVKIHEIDLNDITVASGVGAFFEAMNLQPRGREIVIPQKQDKTTQFRYGADEFKFMEKLIDGLRSDPCLVGREFFKSGRRLATPRNELVDRYITLQRNKKST